MLYGWGGIAAFNVAEFDLAEKWLRVAKERNILSRLGREVEGLGETCLIDMAFAKGAWKKEQAIRQTEAKASTPETWLPRVLLRTSKGDIELELFENEAPNTVANFISLVERSYYNGTVFHRVIEHFMAQGGVPPGGRGADIGYTIPCECYQPNYRVHFRGSLSMALPADGRDKGSNQFFLTFRPTHHLDGKHTCFGRVVKGMEVLSKLQRIVPERMDTGEPDKILEAKVLRKRKHPYEPKKLVRGS
jgi:cyclophilin family peptidyl-prolyl cis-trans isomerase